MKLTELTKLNRCLEISNQDLREEYESCLFSIDESKFSRINELVFEACKLSPEIFAKLLLKLENVKKLEFRWCDCHDSVYKTVPVVARRLEKLTVSLDLGGDGHDRGDFLDCHEILMHPKIRLPAKWLDVNREPDRDVCWCGDDSASVRGPRYLERFDLELERHSYMVDYVERFKSKVLFISFGSGRWLVWEKLAKDYGLSMIQVQIFMDIERREREDDEEFERDHGEAIAKRRKLHAARKANIRSG